MTMPTLNWTDIELLKALSELINRKPRFGMYVEIPDNLAEAVGRRLEVLKNDNAKLEAKIARLVEVGDKAINAVMDETGFATMCPICRFTDDDQEVMTHSPDCPVTLWNKEAHE